MAIPQPDINITNTPTLLNLSFGKNVFSFYDSNTTGRLMRLEVWDNTLTTQIATLEQYPNQTGNYHIDLQNILQNYTTPNYDIEEGVTYLDVATDESYGFRVKYGYIGTTGNFIEQGIYPNTGSTDNCVVLGGVKPYYELEWDSSDYTTLVSGILGCPLPGTDKASALTDWTITKPLSQLTGGIPSYVTTYNDEVTLMEKRMEDSFNLSFLNKFELNSVNPPPSLCENIKAFRITFYNNDTEISDLFIDNIVSQGGGPSIGVALPADVVYPYDAITFKCGYTQFESNMSGATHFYVSGFNYYGGGSCSNIDLKYSIRNHTKVYRVNIVDDKCNDFAPVQVSWLNSLGFRDYFYFSKRTNEDINIRRNTYERVEGSWNSTNFEVPQYSRGEQVFSQDITNTRTINTRFLSDAEAQYLKYLYMSPDVRVRYDGDTSWTPVILTSNRWTEKTFRKDKLFQYTLNYREAHKRNSQRG
jgi:hypothetical protein